MFSWLQLPPTICQILHEIIIEVTLDKIRVPWIWSLKLWTCFHIRPCLYGMHRTYLWFSPIKNTVCHILLSCCMQRLYMCPFIELMHCNKPNITFLYRCVKNTYQYMLVQKKCNLLHNTLKLSHWCLTLRHSRPASHNNISYPYIFYYNLIQLINLLSNSFCSNPAVYSNIVVGDVPRSIHYMMQGSGIQ